MGRTWALSLALLTSRWVETVCLLLRLEGRPRGFVTGSGQSAGVVFLRASWGEMGGWLPSASSSVECSSLYYEWCSVVMHVVSLFLMGRTDRLGVT